METQSVEPELLKEKKECRHILHMCLSHWLSKQIWVIAEGLLAVGFHCFPKTDEAYSVEF